jgi:hypothetical protein
MIATAAPGRLLIRRICRVALGAHLGAAIMSCKVKLYGGLLVAAGRANVIPHSATLERSFFGGRPNVRFWREADLRERLRSAADDFA